MRRCSAHPAAHAVEAVNVRTDAAAIDLTDAVDFQHTDGDRIQVSTAPGADGIIRRIEVRAREAGTNWAVFALANNGDEQIDRLIVAPHYRMVGSGLIWPDLGLSRIVYITPSSGDPPERQDNASADVFRITLDPGTVITFVAELRTDNLPQLYLWEPDAYKDKVNSLTLYQGIVIGIAGLLALFLTILFVVKGSVMFPAAAALGWAVLIYIGIDFGFWPKVFDMSSGAERIWRASGEAILAATLLVFLFAYLNLNRWHVRYAHITVGWLAFLGALVAVALFSPAVASGIARISLFFVAVLGFALVIYLATHDYDRAVMLIPTWLLLGRLGDRRGADGAGLCHQRHRRTGSARRPRPHRHADRLYGDAARLCRRHDQRHRVRRRAPRAGADRRRRHDLGLGRLRRQGLHQPRDRNGARTQAADRSTARRPNGSTSCISSTATASAPRSTACSSSGAAASRRISACAPPTGIICGSRLRARPVVGSDGEVVRLVGTLTDVTEFKTAEERLLHDAVHDNLTGLPNRELFLDRLEAVLGFAKADAAIRPTVMVIDLDRFKQVNDSVGMAVGDSILLTLARRLGRLIKPQDTLARLSGDQFGLILLSETRIRAHHRVCRNHPPDACARRSRSAIAKYSSPPRSD